LLFANITTFALPNPCKAFPAFQQVDIFSLICSMSPKEKSYRKKPSKRRGAIVSANAGNYETHPFFVKKAKKAKTYLNEAGLPKQIIL
jgi:hypothetical protein